MGEGIENYIERVVPYGIAILAAGAVASSVIKYLFVTSVRPPDEKIASYLERAEANARDGRFGASKRQFRKADKLLPRAQSQISQEQLGELRTASYKDGIEYCLNAAIERVALGDFHEMDHFILEASRFASALNTSLQPEILRTIGAAAYAKRFELASQSALSGGLTESVRHLTEAQKLNSRFKLNVTHAEFADSKKSVYSPARERYLELAAKAFIHDDDLSGAETLLSNALMCQWNGKLEPDGRIESLGDRIRTVWADLRTRDPD